MKLTDLDVPVAGRAGYCVAIRHMRLILDDYYATHKPTCDAGHAERIDLVAEVQSRLPAFAVRHFMDPSSRDDDRLVGDARAALDAFDIQLEHSSSPSALIASSVQLRRALDRLLTHVTGTP